MYKTEQGIDETTNSTILFASENEQEKQKSAHSRYTILQKDAAKKYDEDDEDDFDDDEDDFNKDENEDEDNPFDKEPEEDDLEEDYPMADPEEDLFDDDEEPPYN